MLVFILIVVGIGIVGGFARVGVPSSQFWLVDQLANPAFYAGFPVGEVTSHPIADGWGTVVLLPQFHRLPGSDASDSQNDAAETTQRQTYQILQKIFDESPVDLVMVEGELAGEVAPTKVATLEEMAKKRETLISQVGLFKQAVADTALDPDLTARILKEVDQLVQAKDREIFLQSAPLKLKAEGRPLTLVGAETAVTQEESRQILRERVYLEDRLAALESSGNHRLANRSTTQPREFFSSTDLAFLRQVLDPEPSLQDDVARLIREAQAVGATDVVAACQAIQTTWQALQIAHPAPARDGVHPTTPARTENPYQDITSQTRLERLLAENTERLEEVVVERRTQEAAVNLAQAMRDHQESVAILQYGAGHEAGLVQAMNRLGLKVITVTPAEVVRVHAAG